MPFSLKLFGKITGNEFALKQLINFNDWYTIKYMKIGTKFLIINRNIDKVRNDFEILTGNAGTGNFDHRLEILEGKISGNNFKFYSINRGRVDTPEFHGELLKKSEDETLLKVDIMASAFHLVLNICWIIFFVPFFLLKIIQDWSKNIIWINIGFSIGAFIYPIICIFYYLYNSPYAK